MADHAKSDLAVHVGRNHQAKGYARLSFAALGLALGLAPAAAQAQALDYGDLALQIDYTADFLTGGGRDRVAFVDNLDIVAEVEAGDTLIHIYGLYNNGRDFSGARFPGGYVASNIETGTEAARLYEAWIEQKFAAGRASLRAGLYDYNSEFDALGASSLFINPVHGIGNDIGQTGQNGPSIFPVTSLAARLAVQPAEGLTIRAAVLDGVPGDPARPKATRIRLGKGDGAMLALEADQRVGDWRFIAGGWRYTAAFDDTLASAQTGSSVMRKGNHGAYLRGEGLVAGQPDAARTEAFFRLGWANGRFNTIEKLASGGVLFHAPIGGRPDDQAGIAMSWSGSSSRARAAGALNGSPLETDEWAVEASYALRLTDWLAIQPDVQYIANPAFEPDRDAWVGGLRLSLSWSD